MVTIQYSKLTFVQNDESPFNCIHDNRRSHFDMQNKFNLFENDFILGNAKFRVRMFFFKTKWLPDNILSKLTFVQNDESPLPKPPQV